MTNTPKPIITVIIPTRNRCETLRATIKTCIDQDCDNLRIIVSDNCSDDATRDVVASMSDVRLTYVIPANRLSMTGNFEFSLKHAAEGYVIFLGDDDGLMPGSVAKVTELVRDTGSRAITSSSVYYTWPNFPLEHVRNIALVRDLGTAVEKRSPKEEVARLIAYEGLERNYIWGLPSAYRGFIRTDVIEQASRNGKYFHSVTPDAYSAFVNSFFIDWYLYSHAPLTIEGVSGKSNGASQIFGKDKGEEARYLSENDIKFNPNLIYAPSPPIILAEAYLQARAQFPEHCAKHDFNIGKVCRAALRDVYSGPNRARVLDAVAKIQEINGMAPSSVETAPFARMREGFALIRQMMGAMEVQCDRFDAFDVYRASLVVNNLLVMHRGPGVSAGLGLVGRKITSRLLRSFGGQAVA